MPTLVHEALLALFDNRPSLAPEMLRDALDYPVPEYDRIEVKDSRLNELVPTEYRADMVLLLRAGEPVLGVVVEVQLGKDPNERYTWPFYAASLRAKYRCPTCLLVVTPDEDVAQWAREPVVTGQPGCIFAPVVLGPDTIPVITDSEIAEAAPEAALLSVMAHGKTPQALRVARTAWEALGSLDEETSRLYTDFIFMAVNVGMREQLEKLMKLENYEYQSEFARRYIALGRSEGLEEGRLATQRAAILSVLDSRGFAPEGQHRRKIEECDDLQTLERWHRRAVTATSVEEVFQEG